MDREFYNNNKSSSDARRKPYLAVCVVLNPSGFTIRQYVPYIYIVLITPSLSSSVYCISFFRMIKFLLARGIAYLVIRRFGGTLCDKSPHILRHKEQSCLEASADGQTKRIRVWCSPDVIKLIVQLPSPMFVFPILRFSVSVTSQSAHDIRLLTERRGPRLIALTPRFVGDMLV